jgi:hypothetical protein
MDEHLHRNLRRWAAADAEGRDDDADEACRVVFTAAAREPVLSPEFTARTLAALAAARAADRQRARRARRLALAGSVAASVALVYFGGGLAAAGLSAALRLVFDVLVTATVSVANGMQAGTGLWGLLTSLGRAAAAFVREPVVTVAMLAMQGIAMVALVALQRYFGTDRESLK